MDLTCTSTGGRHIHELKYSCNAALGMTSLPLKTILPKRVSDELSCYLHGSIAIGFRSYNCCNLEF